MQKPNNRVAILQKGNLYAAIAVDFDCPTNTPNITLSLVGSSDPRCQHPRFIQSFKNAADAENNFNEALATSRDRGWTIAHIGNRNNGENAWTQ